MNPLPGEVWMADFGFAAKFRPVVMVSRQDPGPLRPASASTLRGLPRYVEAGRGC